MDLAEIISFTLACSILASVPGPTLLLVINYALRYGRSIGRLSIPAVALGDAAAVLLSLGVVGITLKQWPSGQLFFKVVGSAYLFYLGIQQILQKAQSEETAAKPRRRGVAMHIFIVTAFNPKTIIFLFVFFPKFIDFHEPYLSQAIILGTIFTFTGVVLAIVYHFIASLANRFFHDPLYVRRLNLLMGSFLCLFGLSALLF